MTFAHEFSSYSSPSCGKGLFVAEPILTILEPNCYIEIFTKQPSVCSTFGMFNFAPPKEKFFDLFKRAAENALAGARALKEMLEH